MSDLRRPVEELSRRIQSRLLSHRTVSTWNDCSFRPPIQKRFASGSRYQDTGRGVGPGAFEKGQAAEQGRAFGAWGAARIPSSERQCHRSLPGGSCRLLCPASRAGSRESPQGHFAVGKHWRPLGAVPLRPRSQAAAHDGLSVSVAGGQVLGLSWQLLSTTFQARLVSLGPAG